MKLITVTAVVVCLSAPAAIAKGHDQGNTAVPGADNVGSVTVSMAQGLGGAAGKRPDDKGPSENNPAKDKAGR